MEYFLTIEQTTPDGIERVTAEAVGTVTGDRANLSYVFDGAQYSLEVSAKAMRQKRAGEVGIDMEFIQGKRTECVLTHGGAGGSFYICTHRLAVRFFGGGFECECTFSDGCGANATGLKISANRIGEQN